MKPYLIILLYLLLVDNAAAQLIITPKSGNIVLHLDASGKYNVNLSDIASVTGECTQAPLININPLFFTCSNLGQQTIKITASCGSSAQFNGLYGISRDQSGNLYVSDLNNVRIRKISTDGIVTTFAGDGTIGAKNGQGTNSSFYQVFDSVTDSKGNLFVIDANNGLIRKITPDGVVSTFATKALSDYAVSVGNPAAGYCHNMITIDKNDNIYVDTYNASILKIPPDGNSYEIIAKTGAHNATDVMDLYIITALTTDASGNIYVASSHNNISTIYKIEPDNTFIKYYERYTLNDSFIRLVADSHNNLYTGLNKSEILKITPDGTASIFAGSETSGYQDGPSADALFDYPLGLAIDPDDNIYITELNNNTVRKITQSGIVTTIAGTKEPGYLDGPALSEKAQLQIPVVITGDMSINPIADQTIKVDKFCPVKLPDYTSLVTVNDNCSNNLKLAQTPAAGTLITNINAIPVTIDAVDEFNNKASVMMKAIPESAPSSPPQISIIASDNNVCEGVPINFTVVPTSAVDGAICQWEVNGNVVLSGQAIFTTNTLKNNDMVTCSLTYSSSCVPPVISLPVQIKINNALSINPVSDQIIEVNKFCPVKLPDYTSLITVNDNCSNNFKLTQTPAAGTLVTDVNAIPVTIDAVDEFNNKTSATFNAIPENVPLSTPSISIIASDNNVCEGDAITFTSEPSATVDDAVYQWEVNGNIVLSGQATFTSNTLKNNDIVTCSLVYSSSCVPPVISLPTQVRINKIPSVSADNVTIVKGEQFEMKPTYTGDIVAYNWQPALGLNDSKSAYPIASPEKSTLYTLTVTSSSNCQNSVNVMVNVIATLSIPNTFTPNADGINDEWDIASLKDYKNCIVDVYNRWGNSVFHSVGYNKPWNGVLNGKPVPFGVYYYKISLNNGSNPLSGYVTLIR